MTKENFSLIGQVLAGSDMGATSLAVTLQQEAAFACTLGPAAQALATAEPSRAVNHAGTRLPSALFSLTFTFHAAL